MSQSLLSLSPQPATTDTATATPSSLASASTQLFELEPAPASTMSTPAATPAAAAPAPISPISGPGHEIELVTRSKGLFTYLGSALPKLSILQLQGDSEILIFSISLWVVPE